MNNNTNQMHSNRQELWKFILLYICTLGLYIFYWFYRNNKQIYSFNNRKNYPFLRTITLILPLINFYFIWDFFVDLKKYADTIPNKFQSYFYPGWCALFFYGFVIFGAKHPWPYNLIGLLTILPLISAQAVINNYWDAQEKINIKKKHFHLLK